MSTTATFTITGVREYTKTEFPTTEVYGNTPVPAIRLVTCGGAFDNATRQLTQFRDFDIKFPSLGDKAIVYENGGWLYRFDLATGAATKIDVQINDDHDSGRGGLRDVSKNVTSFGISPDGKQLFFTRDDVRTDVVLITNFK
jgi:tricorn protease-like protein